MTVGNLTVSQLLPSFPTGFKPAETFCQATQPQLEARPFVDANYG